MPLQQKRKLAADVDLKGGDEMRRTIVTLSFVVMITLGVGTAEAQEGQNLRSWWVAGEFGEGQLSLNSDQVHRNRAATFALGFVGGHRLEERARVGWS